MPSSKHTLTPDIAYRALQAASTNGGTSPLLLQAIGKAITTPVAPATAEEKPAPKQAPANEPT